MTSTPSAPDFSLHPIGFVRSPILLRKHAPKQASEGAPDAWLDLDPAIAEGLTDIAVGQEVILLTWLHQGRRNVLKVHPRGNPQNPLMSVFATRSPDRPNPIGIHRVRVREIADSIHLRVGPLEVINGTPVLDIKPVLPGLADTGIETCPPLARC
jgi:tRNA-Thr(GGU) m(6)t(6)A37 methyltransferase TsaA